MIQSGYYTVIAVDSEITKSSPVGAIVAFHVVHPVGTSHSRRGQGDDVPSC